MKDILLWRDNWWTLYLIQNFYHYQKQLSLIKSLLNQLIALGIIGNLKFMRRWTIWTYQRLRGKERTACQHDVSGVYNCGILGCEAWAWVALCIHVVDVEAWDPLSSLSYLQYGEHNRKLNQLINQSNRDVFHFLMTKICVQIQVYWTQ